MAKSCLLPYDGNGSRIFRIAVVIPAPYGGHAQILETPLKQASHCFRYQPPSPIRLAYPVADLCLSLPHLSTVQSVAAHDARASDRLARLFLYHGVCLGGGKHSPDNLQTVLYGSVRRPSGCLTYCRVFSVFV